MQICRSEKGQNTILANLRRAKCRYPTMALSYYDKRLKKFSSNQFILGRVAKPGHWSVVIDKHWVICQQLPGNYYLGREIIQYSTNIVFIGYLYRYQFREPSSQTLSNRRHGELTNKSDILLGKIEIDLFQDKKICLHHIIK